MSTCEHGIPSAAEWQREAYENAVCVIDNLHRVGSEEIARLRAQRDALAARLAMAVTFDVGDGIRLVADDGGGWTFWRGEEQVPELTPGEGAFDSRDAAFAALDRARKKEGGT